MSASPIEVAKRTAAQRAVAEHFEPSSTFVGIGSGTTILYVVDAIKEALARASSTGQANRDIRFVPTGYQSRQVIVKAGLMPIAFDELPDGVLLDACFDGADEVDADLNCVKGGGACLFQEKLVAERSKRFVCVADYRKAQPSLLTAWPTIPIEVAPSSANVVVQALRALGSAHPKVRDGVMEKTGPMKTDQGFFIVDAPFPTLLTRGEAGEVGADGRDAKGRWEVNELSRRIKLITGVLEVGLFCGVDGDEAQAQGLPKGGQRPVACYFGMQDGSVQVRTAAATAPSSSS